MSDPVQPKTSQVFQQMNRLAMLLDVLHEGQNELSARLCPVMSGGITTEQPRDEKEEELAPLAATLRHFCVSLERACDQNTRVLMQLEL